MSIWKMLGLFLIGVVFTTVFYVFLNLNLVTKSFQSLILDKRSHEKLNVNELFSSILLYQNFTSKENLTLDKRPCEKIKDTELFLRTFSGRKLLYKYVFQKSLSIFWACREKLKLAIVLDNESKADHEWGKELEKEFPNPRVMYEDPFPNIYHSNGHIRQQISMFYAEKYTNATYVGFVDSDTFFTTVVTPGILFEDGKPIIIGRMGHDNSYWEAVTYNTEKWFGHKEVLKGMSYFPVIIKVEHIIELRKWLERKHKAIFNDIFSRLTEGDSFSQFTIMCQYVWMFHRNEYSFHFELMPNGMYDYAKASKGRAPPSYYKENLKPEHWLPKPRSSIHWGYPQPYPSSAAELSEKWLELFIRDGFCYSIGMKYCSKACNGYKFSKVHKRLYLFEGDTWEWHKHTLRQQYLHYEEVHHLILHMNRTGKGVLGFDSIEEACIQWPRGYNFVYPMGKVPTRHSKGKP